MTRPETTLARELEAALAFWQAAGVDCDFVDDATAWLADPAAQSPRNADAPGAAEGDARSANPAQIAEPNRRAMPVSAPVAAAPAVLRRNLLGDSPPANLPAFHEWWMEAPGLDTARGFPRVPPRGKAGAALMILTVQPEFDDREQLLAGPQGRLLGRMLAAMGLDESAVYVASALACHTPMADLAALAAGGMDAVTAHHIRLVAPARVLALGAGLSPMLTEINPNSLSRNNHANANRPVMISETLEAMMEMPRLKARFWRRWMEWSATN